jgi:hypothetical protein
MTGAVVSLTRGRDGESVMNVKQFEAVPHPCCLPKSLNAFSWSLGFALQSRASVFCAACCLQWLTLIDDAVGQFHADVLGMMDDPATDSDVDAVRTFSGFSVYC